MLNFDQCSVVEFEGLGYAVRRLGRHRFVGGAIGVIHDELRRGIRINVSALRGDAITKQDRVGACVSTVGILNRRSGIEECATATGRLRQ